MTDRVAWSSGSIADNAWKVLPPSVVRDVRMPPRFGPLNLYGPAHERQRFVGICLAECLPFREIVRLFQLPALARVVTSGDDADLRRFRIHRVVVRVLAVGAPGKA